MFDTLKSVARLNVALGFELKNVEDGSCGFYYAQAIITLMERSKFVATTREDKK